MIYVGGRYTCNVEGSVWKEVVCHGCHCEYLYCMSRTGSGTGRSPYYMDNDGAQRRAQERAAQNLQRKLLRDCDAVACPECGMYQANMVRLLRRRRWGWLHICGWVGAAAALVLAWMCIISEPLPRQKPIYQELISMPSVAVLGIGLSLIALSWGGRMLQDPNASSVERAGAPRTAQEGPYRRAEYEALVREAIARNEAARQAEENVLQLQPALRQVWCPSCEQTFKTSSHDRCPLCHADWTQTPPQDVA